LSDSIVGVIKGTETVEQAFARMFENIGRAFIDMATQMLAQKLFTTVLQALGGGAPRVGPQIFNLNGFGSLPSLPFSEGGFVTSPTRALVGEGGSPEYVIPGKKMAGALERYNNGIRGEAVLSGAETEGGGGYGVMAEAPTSINISGGVMQFGGDEYIRKDQLPSIISQAGQQGEKRALLRLRNSPSSRRRIGL